jgi:hypothetical protein
MVLKSKFFLSFFMFFLCFLKNLLIETNTNHYFTKKNLNDKEISQKNLLFILHIGGGGMEK